MLDSLDAKHDIFAALHPHIEDIFYDDHDDYVNANIFDSNFAITYSVTVHRQSSIYTWTLYTPLAGARPQKRILIYLQEMNSVISSGINLKKTGLTMPSFCK